MKIVIRADGFDIVDDRIEFFLDEKIYTVIKDWKLVENLSEEEAQFIEDALEEDCVASKTKKNLNHLMTGFPS